MTETEALIALNQLPKIGPVKTNALVTRFGSAVKTLQASSSELTQASGIGEQSAEVISNWESYADPSAEIQLAQEREIQILTKEDEGYPQKLLESHDAPVLLYVWGQLEDRDDYGIAVVGSRKCTHYGRECARKFSFQLAQAGVTDKNKDSIQGVLEDLHENMFPDQKQEKLCQADRARELMEKYSQTPIQVTAI